MARPDPALQHLHRAWQNQWEPALAAWSRFTKLTRPRWCLTVEDEKKEGISGTFAMIRLEDHAVVVSLRLVRQNGLEKFPREILAHEIGHHVYTPADLTDNARLMARTRAGLPSREHQADFIANLYTDLLINDRLQRSAGLAMSGVYKALDTGKGDALWTLYMRIYELLWKLPLGTLAKGKTDSRLNGDAQLGTRLIRVYAKDWLDGAGRFAALCLPYLLKDKGKDAGAIFSPLMDSAQAGAGPEIPEGLAEIDRAEQEGSMHPSLDPALSGVEEHGGDGEKRQKQNSAPEAQGGRETVGGQKNEYRSPDEYAELMKSLGVTLSESEIAICYYRERAMPHLIRFPARKVPEATDPQPEGEEIWDIGSPVSDIDWIGSVIRSPQVVPGMTTVQRVYGETKGSNPEQQPVDLYLGIDCSGSMPNPRCQLSFPVLAGTIMALSALRAGARVMAVLSGEPGEFSETDGFTRSEQEVMKVLTGYLGTGYAFGIMRLKDAFLGKDRPLRKTHILIMTDSDIFSMLGSVKNGWDIARNALDIAGGGGTYVLHRINPNYPEIRQMKDDGWDVFGLDEWESLIEFARAFSRKKYEDN